MKFSAVVEFNSMHYETDIDMDEIYEKVGQDVLDTPRCLAAIKEAILDEIWEQVESEYWEQEISDIDVPRRTLGEPELLTIAGQMRAYFNKPVIDPNQLTLEVA